jgi:hypothetical protein
MSRMKRAKGLKGERKTGTKDKGQATRNKENKILKMIKRDKRDK